MILITSCFHHDMAYGKYKNLATISQYQRGVASMVCKFFDKKSKGSGVATLANKYSIKSMSNQQLANELHKLIIRKF